MITKCSSVVSDCRHRFIFDLAFIEVEVGGSLESITGINQKSIGILSPYLLHQRCAASNASLARVSIIVRQRINLRMGIVRVENRDKSSSRTDASYLGVGKRIEPSWNQCGSADRSRSS